MKVLGFGGPGFLHDPAAAIVIDGKVVAAAEEERFIREKHAVGKPCLRSIEFCLEQAGITPKDIDAVLKGEVCCGASQNKLLISIAAGISTAHIEKIVGKLKDKNEFVVEIAIGIISGLKCTSSA